MSDQLPPAGWYPAPYANNELRYWDGTQWLEPMSTAGSAEEQATTPTPTPITDSGSSAEPGVPKKSKNAWIVGGSVAAGILLIGGIGTAINGGAETKPTTTVTPWSAPETPYTAPVNETEMIEVPDVTGLPVRDAVSLINAAGLVAPELSTFDDPEAPVIETSPASGYKVEAAREIAITVDDAPRLTLPQQNAISKAQSYLSMTGFSRTGLIDQLEFEGFSAEEATFGADNAGADWNAEAAEKAQSYLDMTSFSRQGLYEQLEYEGFTPEQIEFGLAAVGY